jgi:hypothetical protein
VFMIAKRMAAKEVLKLRFLILINVLAIAWRTHEYRDVWGGIVAGVFIDAWTLHIIPICKQIHSGKKKRRKIYKKVINIAVAPTLSS